MRTDRVSTEELLRKLSEFEPEPTDYFRHGAARIAASLSAVPPGSGKVLELGCDSHFSLALSLFSTYDVVPQNRPVPIAAPEAALTASVEFRGRDGSKRIFDRVPFDAESETFPFPDASFDGVLFCEMIEHLFIDPAAVLAESYRVLKPNGWLLLTTPNLTSYWSILRAVKGGHPMEHSKYFHPKHGGAIQHTREYGFWEIVSLLESAGFRADEKETLTLFDHERLALLDYLLIPFLALYNLVQLRHPKHVLMRYRRPHTFVIARKSGVPTDRYPLWLYVKQGDGGGE